MKVQTLAIDIFRKRIFPTKNGKKKIVIHLEKRQKFVIAVLVLSLGLFSAEFQFGKSGVVTALVMSLFTDLFLFWAIREDMKDRYSLNALILPFVFSIACGLFYFLTPARILSRIIFTGLFGFGLYSLYLSQNIFVVGSIRTIALLSGARIVSFVITLLSFFFLTNIVFTLHLWIIPTILIIAIYTYILIYQSIWTYVLQKSETTNIPLWVFAVTACLIETVLLLWFWPTGPTVLALFLTGFFYTLVGLSHVWFERRLFRGVLWEYVWVGVVVFFILLLFTQWGK